MNIAVNTRLLLKYRLEGIGRYTYETTRRIVLSRPDDQFFFFFDRAYDPSFIFAENVTPIVLNPPTRHPILIKWWFEKRLPKAFKKHKIDVFLSADNIMSTSTRVPTVLVIHDLAFHHYPEHFPDSISNFYNKNIRTYINKSKSVIAVSETTKEDIIKTYGTAEQKIKVAYNSAPIAFSPLEYSEKLKIRNQYSDGKPYFIYLGAIHPRKNTLRLLQAFEDFKTKHQTDHYLLLVGRKAWKNKDLDTFYDQMSFKNQVVFLNHVPEVNPLMAAAEALVYVSVFEGFGIPILEAVHSSVPVITSNISSMPEVAGDAALLVDPFDPNSISEAMQKISSNSSLREDLIAKGNNRKKDFNWDASAKVISNELNQLS